MRKYQFKNGVLTGFSDGLSGYSLDNEIEKIVIWGLNRKVRRISGASSTLQFTQSDNFRILEIKRPGVFVTQNFALKFE
jgi:hypothetical protein